MSDNEGFVDAYVRHTVDLVLDRSRHSPTRSPPGARQSSACRTAWPRAANGVAAGRGRHDCRRTGLLCTTILLYLRRQTDDASRGTIVLVIATDLVVPLDLPAWCPMTGHTPTLA
ncbi:sulfurtransferase TusA family protein [Streptomyces sp. enrichment culture]|uniref:sulfurtransferase TusA family protein n=1 Tax=Streptomyces sp. enrichment culture TaxID=1795815 RepID=UPI003F565D87